MDIIRDCFIICCIVELCSCSEVKEIPRDSSFLLTDVINDVKKNVDIYIEDINDEKDGGFSGLDDAISKDAFLGDIFSDVAEDVDTGIIDAGICSQSLFGRLKTKRLDIAPDSINTMGGLYFSYYTPPIIRSYKGGYVSAYLNYGGNVRVMLLNDNFVDKGVNVRIDANELRGLAVSDNIFAVLVQRGTDEMAILGYDFSGVQRFDTTIIGKTDHNVAWSKYIKREWGDYGTLGFYDNQFVAYFGHAMNWGESGEHQGDLLWFFDLEGNRVGGLWDWGCSHSLDVRLSFNSHKIGAVCLSDCYPQKAICFNHRESIIHNEPSGNCAGRSNAILGGLVAFEDGFYQSFISSEGRQSSDVAIVRVSNNGIISEPIWITDTPDVQEEDVHLARYGENLLLVYKYSNITKAGIIGKDGRLILGFEELNELGFNQQTLFENNFNGDVIWAFGEGSVLNIYIVKYCN